MTEKQVNCVFFQRGQCHHPEAMIASRFNSFYRELQTATDSAELKRLLDKATSDVYLYDIKGHIDWEERRQKAMDKISKLSDTEIRGLTVDFFKQMMDVWQLRETNGRCNFDSYSTEIMLQTCGGRVAIEPQISQFETKVQANIDYHRGSLLADKKSADLILGWFEEELF